MFGRMTFSEMLPGRRCSIKYISHQSRRGLLPMHTCTKSENRSGKNVYRRAGYEIADESRPM